jgi:hypothetical protein
MNGQIYTLGIRIPVEIPENILLLFYGLINPGRWLRITVFLAVTSPYTVVYEEIWYENGPYLTVYGRIHAVFFDQGNKQMELFRYLLTHCYLQKYRYKK